MTQPIIPPQHTVILITKRKCGHKVQPHVQVGTPYIVKRVEYLKNGSPVVVVADNLKQTELRINSERFEWKQANFSDLKEQNFKDKCSKETAELMDNFSFDEHVHIAFTPLVISHIAFEYGKQCREAAVKHKVPILRPLTQAFDKLQREYYDEMRRDLDNSHRQQIEEQAARLRQTFAWDFQVFWFSVNSELKRVCPNYPLLDLRTNALCGAIMVDILREHDKSIDKKIKDKLKRPTNTITNPKMHSLRHLLMGYAGEADKFNFTAPNVALAKTILRKRINEIQFEIIKDV